jgi:hypothetical protein
VNALDLGERGLDVFARLVETSAITFDYCESLKRCRFEVAIRDCLALLELLLKVVERLVLFVQ